MKRFALRTIPLIALSGLSGAQKLPVAGPALPGPVDSPEGNAVFDAAGRHPNATSTVTFTRNFNGNAEQWTWRVNISDVAVPNDLSDLGKTSANSSLGLHIANVEGQLSWPSNARNASETLEQFLEAQNTTLYANFQSLNVATDLAAKYMESSNGDCSAILGPQCVKSLMQNLASKGQNFSMEEVDGCQSTIGTARGLGSDLLISPGSGSSQAVLMPGNASYFLASETFDGENSTVYREAAGALQLLLIDFVEESEPSIQHSGETGAFVLCQVISKTANTSQNTSQENKSSDAVTLHPTALTLSIGLVSSLFALGW